MFQSPAGGLKKRVDEPLFRLLFSASFRCRETSSAAAGKGAERPANPPRSDPESGCVVSGCMKVESHDVKRRDKRRSGFHAHLLPGFNQGTRIAQEYMPRRRRFPLAASKSGPRPGTMPRQDGDTDAAGRFIGQSPGVAKAHRRTAPPGAERQTQRPFPKPARSDNPAGRWRGRQRCRRGTFHVGAIGENSATTKQLTNVFRVC